MMLRTGSDLLIGLARKRVSGFNPSTRSSVHRLTKGFTLVEVILSVAIITTGLVFILQAIGKEINAVSLADDKIQTVLFLKDKIDEVEAEFLEKEKIIPGFIKGEVVKNGKSYKWVLSINEDKRFKNLYEIKTVCSWQKFGREKTSTLATLFYKAEKEEGGQ